MHKILLFTDLHVQEEGRKIIGLDSHDRFFEALDHALKVHPDAQHIVIMGDLTHSGKIAEFERVKTLLDSTGLPYSAMLGNHDNRDNFLKVFEQAAQTEQGHIQSIIPIGKDRLILLDTLDGPPFRRDRHSGLLCENRLEWLRRALSRTVDRRVIILTHHPPFRVGFPGMDSIRLRNDKALLDVLKQHPNIAHLLSGHIHRTISGSIDGLGFTVLKSPTHQMPMMLESEATAYSVPEPGAYGIMFLFDDSVVVHSEDFQLAQIGAALSYDAEPDKN